MDVAFGKLGVLAILNDDDTKPFAFVEQGDGEIAPVAYEVVGQVRELTDQIEPGRTDVLLG